MFDIRLRFLQRLALSGLLAWASTAALADPPARVGRLVMIDGPVKFYADQEEGWQEARLNLPVTGENSIWTEGRARAEWRTGPVAIRLDHDSVLDVQKLEDQSAVLYIQRGAVNLRIGLLEKGESWIVHTPEGQLSLRARGSYRIEADFDKAETRIAVLAGRARLDSRAGSPWIEAGRMALLERGSLRMEALARTDFDDWAQARDEGLDPSEATHVSPYMTGYEDLSRHGTWEPAEEYGNVWFPSRIEADWAPYRQGSWRYVRPWGWTWIDDAPWGFAPFHYGRWVQVRGRWAWWPGNRIYRPVYSPALVAWVGGDGWSISLGSGRGPAIGWFPLAPWEAYVPWYSHSPTYIYNINHIHAGRPVHTRPPRDYRNFRPGTTVVPPSTFDNRQPVWRDRIRNPGESLWTQKPVQSGNMLPPRPAQGRPGYTKPAPLPDSGSPSGQRPQTPGYVPMPLPGREAAPRFVQPAPQGPQTPQTQQPRPMPMPAQPSGAKPGVLPPGETARDSMPSRPAPARQSAPTQSGAPAMQGTATNRAPESTTPATPSSMRSRSSGEPVSRDTRVQPDSRQRDVAPLPDARAPRADRIDRSDRGERSDRPRQEAMPARPATSDRAPAPERSAPAAAQPRDKPDNRGERERERSADKPEREVREKNDRGERTVIK